MTASPVPGEETPLPLGPRSGKGPYPSPPLAMDITKAASSAWRFLFNSNQQIPKTDPPSMTADLTEFKNREKGKFSSIWLGHSSLMINVDGYRILTDPVLEKKVTPLGPGRFYPLPINLADLPEIDVVIISHDHYDHLNKFSIMRLEKITKKFITPLGVGKRLKAWGVPGQRVVELNWWESHTFSSRLSITATPAQHFSGRGILDRNKTLWASWVIQSSAHTLFFSGDSGYFNGFKAIGNAFGPFDMTFLECGAYDKDWPLVHMFPEETVQAHQDLGGKILHPIHLGTFKLAHHPWFEPMERLAEAAKKAGIPMATPMAGETVGLNPERLGSQWWKTTPPITDAITERLKPQAP